MSETVVRQSLNRGLAAHFDGRDPMVKSIYDKLVSVSKNFGRVTVEPKKTSIHLVNRSAFAGIQTRRKFLILTVKAADDIPSDRFFRREQASANRWHLETKIETADQVDAELIHWLSAAYDISS